MPPLDEILPTDAEIELGLVDGLAEAIENDTMRPGVVKEVIEGKVVLIASYGGCGYSGHDIVSPEEAKARFKEDPLIKVLSLREWYESLEL